MASLMRKTLLYLGLAPDSEYEDLGHDDDAPAVESTTRVIPPQAVKQPAAAAAVPSAAAQEHEDAASALLRLHATEDEDGGGEPGPVEQVSSEPDDRFEKVVLEEPLPDGPLLAAPKQNPVREDDGDTADLGRH